MSTLRNLLDSSEDPSRTGYLIGCFITQSLSEEEREELEQWIHASDRNMRVFEELTDPARVDEMLQWIATSKTEGRLKLVKQRIKFTKERKVNWWGMAAAAMIVSVISITAFYFLRRDKGQDQPIAAMNVSQDLQPGEQYAELHLPDGRKVNLEGVRDTAFDGIRIKDGAIVYEASPEIAMHEVVVPKKGFYTLVLPDGTKVQLNNASSITYPSRFEGATREVKITGESYFDVAKDKAHPFIVHSGDTKVQAVGTAFNVNGFDGSITLVEGKVKVNDNVFLNPGQSYANGEVTTTDVATATAWTRNEFKFRNVTLNDIAPLLERWYDCQVIFKDAVPDHFCGVIARTVPVSKVMELLQGAGNFNYVINDHVITITN